MYSKSDLDHLHLSINIVKTTSILQKYIRKN